MNRNLPKLVRDKAIYEGNVYRTVKDDTERLELLSKKLQEELGEVLEANAKGDHGQLVEECGDLMEVIRGLFKVLQVDPVDIDYIAFKKRQNLGAFNDGLVLEECGLWEEK